MICQLSIVTCHLSKLRISESKDCLQALPSGATSTKLIANCPLEMDFSHCPDIAQTLAVTCCLLDVPFTFSGIHSLRIKETDRVAALITELSKLGYVLRAEGDELLIWDGERTEPRLHPTIATYDDHRMAMALAPVSIYMPGIVVRDIDVVTKSYPSFWEDLQTAGFTVVDAEVEIEIDNSDAPVEYYNLQGIRVDAENIVPGFYIVRQGEKTQKVFINE